MNRSASSPAIEVNGLVKTFRSRSGARGDAVRALAGATLRVEPGEIVALSGRNGSGKTTLLKILATLVTPDAGVVRVGGFSWENGREIRRRVGLLTADERSFYWRLTGRQNLRFFASLHGLSRARGASVIADLERRFAMEAYIDRRFDTYSSGMKQTLALTRAWLHDPGVLLLDEPTRSLDEQSVERLFLFLRARAKDHACAILFVTHHRDEAKRWANRVLHIDGGAIVAEEGA